MEMEGDLSEFSRYQCKFWIAYANLGEQGSRNGIDRASGADNLATKFVSVHLWGFKIDRNPRRDVLAVGLGDVGVNAQS